MFGWEFPPVFAGGVGIVCYELTKELSKQNVDIDYVIPFSAKELHNNFLHILSTEDGASHIGVEQLSSFSSSISSQNKLSNIEDINFIQHHIPSLLSAYVTEDSFKELQRYLQSEHGKEYLLTLLEKISGNELTSLSELSRTPSQSTQQLYGENLLQEVELFKERTLALAEKGELKLDSVDIIHAHDWTTLPAAKAIKDKTGIPYVAHVHITEINKTAGAGVNQDIYDVEREGFQNADKLLAVSKSIKQTLIDNYGIDPSKIEVVYNASITDNEEDENEDGTQNKEYSVKETNAEEEKIKTKTGAKKQQYLSKEKLRSIKSNDEQLVSFMGRITGMKGPEHFVRMAQRVLEIKPKTKFLVAGTGDKLPQVIALTKQLGIEDKFYFHGFYNRKEAKQFFKLSDVFVLPSLMEPFGITPLEAMKEGTPVIVSKQSGISEVLKHCFRTDFWDIDKMASQVVSLLTYPELAQEMIKYGAEEEAQQTWDKPAKQCMSIYEDVIKQRKQTFLQKQTNQRNQNNSNNKMCFRSSSSFLHSSSQSIITNNTYAGAKNK